MRQGGQSYETGKLNFHNNYARNEEIGGMPEKDFTVEMWVRTAAFQDAEAVQGLICSLTLPTARKLVCHHVSISLQCIHSLVCSAFAALFCITQSFECAALQLNVYKFD